MGRYKPWTDEEVAILKELYPNSDIELDQIARALGRSKGAIKSKATALSLERIWKPHIDRKYLEGLRTVVKF